MAGSERADEFWSRYSGAGRGPRRPGAGKRAQGTDGSGADDGRYTGEAADEGRSADADDGSRSADAGDGTRYTRRGDGHRCLEWCPICRGAERLEESIPPELLDQLRIVQRDALLLMRAAIDAHLTRVDDPWRAEDRKSGPARGDSSFEDIPID